MGLTEETGMEFLNLPQTKTTQVTITQSVKNKGIVFTISYDDKVVDTVSEWYYLILSLIKIYTEGLQRKEELIFIFTFYEVKFMGTLLYPHTKELNNSSLSLDKFYKELLQLKLGIESYQNLILFDYTNQQKILNIINIINENTDLSSKSNDYKDGFKEALQIVANSIGQ